MAVHLRRLLPAVVAFFMLMADRIDACAICFAGVDSPLLDSARLGVLAMAAVTVTVLSAFGVWFVRLARLEAGAALAGENYSPDPAPRTLDPGSR